MLFQVRRRSPRAVNGRGEQRRENVFDLDSPHDVSTVNSLASIERPSSATGSEPPKISVSLTPAADMDPGVTMSTPTPMPMKSSHMSQSTEHLLIAAGSIGATILLMMIVWAIYMMRSRRLTFKELLMIGKSSSSDDRKRGFKEIKRGDESYASDRGDIYFAPPPAAKVRTSWTANKAPLQPVSRADSFALTGTGRNSLKDFFGTESERNPSGRHSAAASSAVLPRDTARQSLSTHNTRSDNEYDHEASHALTTPVATPAIAPAPSFHQFLANRPPLVYAASEPIASRFSWTNSNAPQTPHDTSRDTMAQPTPRESYMTTRSSVPRFRTIDSWVNQQSNRVAAKELKDQFRMTQSTMNGGDDERDAVPAMPALPTQQSLKEMSGLAGREIKSTRKSSRKANRKTGGSVASDTKKFNAHPGTEIRFSVRSEVPSEVLDSRVANVLEEDRRVL